MEKTNDKYTPGPWEELKDPKGNTYAIITGEGNSISYIALFDGKCADICSANFKENAKLIASAPQLKADNEALKADNVKWYGAYRELLAELKEAGRYFDKQHNPGKWAKSLSGKINLVLQKHTQTESNNTKTK